MFPVLPLLIGDYVQQRVMLHTKLHLHCTEIFFGFITCVIVLSNKAHEASASWNCTFLGYTMFGGLISVKMAHTTPDNHKHFVQGFRDKKYSLASGNMQVTLQYAGCCLDRSYKKDLSKILQSQSFVSKKCRWLQTFCSKMFIAELRCQLKHTHYFSSFLDPFSGQNSTCLGKSAEVPFLQSFQKQMFCKTGRRKKRSL